MVCNVVMAIPTNYGVDVVCYVVVVVGVYVVDDVGVVCVCDYMACRVYLVAFVVATLSMVVLLVRLQVLPSCCVVWVNVDDRSVGNGGYPGDVDVGSSYVVVVGIELVFMLVLFVALMLFILVMMLWVMLVVA